MRNKKPTNIDTQILQPFIDSVKPGNYLRFSASSQLPDGVPWGGPDCECVLLAASTYSGQNIPDLPEAMTPDSNIYLWRAFRNNASGSPPRKTDDCLYYVRENDNVAWRIHSKDSPDHHYWVMSGSGLSALIDDYHMPSASSGTLNEYRSSGGLINFDSFFED